MMHVTEYQNLIRHMEWADALIWRSVLSLPLGEHEGWMRQRLHHYHSTQWAYGQVLRSQPIEIPKLSSFPDLRSMGLWARDFYREATSYFDGLDESVLQQMVDFPWSARVVKRLGSVGPATAGESILQLVLHTAYHRGQVSGRLREAGGEPPLTDFIAWIWMHRPGPDWGALETT